MRLRMKSSKTSAGCLLGTLGILVLAVGSALAQVTIDNACTAPVPHSTYVVDSNTLIQSDAARQEVMSRLTCIARSDRSELNVGTPAVRALFALARTDAEVNEYLLQIVGDLGTRVPVHEVACELLVYVATADTRKAMLDLLNAEWPNTRWSGYFAFFRELGDTDFLAWLGRELRRKDEGVFSRSILEQYERSIQIQQNTDDLLAYLRSERSDLDTAWVVRQAVRRGAGRSAVREAVLARLLRSGEVESRDHHTVSLVRESQNLGVFDSEDRLGMSLVADVLSARHLCSDWSWPVWAIESIARKRAEFYHPSEVPDWTERRAPLEDDK